MVETHGAGPAEARMVDYLAQMAASLQRIERLIQAPSGQAADQQATTGPFQTAPYVEPGTGADAKRAPMPDGDADRGSRAQDRGASPREASNLASGFDGDRFLCSACGCRISDYLEDTRMLARGIVYCPACGCKIANPGGSEPLGWMGELI